MNIPGIVEREAVFVDGQHTGWIVTIAGEGSRFFGAWDWTDGAGGAGTGDDTYATHASEPTFADQRAHDVTWMTAAERNEAAMDLKLRITAIERLQNTAYGNPRFAISFVDDGGIYSGTWRTAANHAFTYEIGNRGRRVGDVVIVAIGGRGTIIGLSDVAS